MPTPRAALGALTGSTFSSLAVVDYRRIFFGNMAFQFSTWMQQLVFGWLLLIIGNSPFWLGMSGFCSGMAMVVMSPIGGALADSWERRKVMMITQTTAVVVNASIALLFWLDRLEIWHLLTASLLMGMSFTMNMPARQSLMAELVPRRLLHNATALHTASMNLARITGPGVAGTLMSLTGPLVVLLINLVANTWTVLQLLTLKYRPSRPPRPFRPRPDNLFEGFRYCWRTRDLFEAMTVISLANLAGLSFVQLLPSFARDSLGVGPEGLGMLTSAMGGGALAGSLLLARRAAVRRGDLVLRVATTLVGLLVFLLGHTDRLLVAAGLLAVIGATNAVITALGLATVQERVPDELSGRVFGVYMQTMALMPLGALPLGALATFIGTAPAISTWGLAGSVVTGGLVATRLMAARRLAAQRATSN